MQRRHLLISFEACFFAPTPAILNLHDLEVALTFVDGPWNILEHLGEGVETSGNIWKLGSPPVQGNLHEELSLQDSVNLILNILKEHLKQHRDMAWEGLGEPCRSLDHFADTRSASPFRTPAGTTPGTLDSIGLNNRSPTPETSLRSEQRGDLPPECAFFWRKPIHPNAKTVQAKL